MQCVWCSANIEAGDAFRERSRTFESAGRVPQDVELLGQGLLYHAFQNGLWP